MNGPDMPCSLRALYSIPYDETRLSAPRPTDRCSILLPWIHAPIVVPRILCNSLHMLPSDGLSLRLDDIPYGRGPIIVLSEIEALKGIVCQNRAIFKRKEGFFVSPSCQGGRNAYIIEVNTTERGGCARPYIMGKAQFLLCNKAGHIRNAECH